MSVFVDTGVFFAQHDQYVSRHEAASSAMKAVFRGAFGQPYTSDYVLDESITLTRSRTNSHEAAWTIAQRILGRGSYPDRIELVQIADELLDDALGAFERYDDQSLSFTDASTIAVVDAHDIDAVLSFDDDFDGIVDRIDPANL